MQKSLTRSELIPVTITLPHIETPIMSMRKLLLYYGSHICNSTLFCSLDKMCLVFQIHPWYISTIEDMYVIIIRSLWTMVDVSIGT